MQKAETILTVLNQKSNKYPKFKFKRLYRLLYNKYFYWNTYYKMCNKQKDKVLTQKINELIENIKLEKYYPKKFIESFYDRLVAEIIKEILQAIYEPYFSKFSCAIKSNNDFYKVFYHIKKNWIQVRWVIKVNLSYSKISHSKIIRILNKKIDDNRFLRLINRFLKAGYIKKLQNEPLGIILINIYLNEFDNYINKLSNNSGKINYCRYLNKFMIGIWNNKYDVLIIKELVINFFRNQLNIELNENKISIVNLKDENVEFLGYEINKKMQFLIPNRIVNKYVSNYCKNGKPIHISQRVDQSEFDIIVQYNSEIKYLYNYYCLANDVNIKLSKVKYYNYNSLIKTLAFKHKCSCKKIIQKFGIDVPLKNETGKTKKLIGIKYKTKEEDKILTYFNDSLRKIKIFDFD